MNVATTVRRIVSSDTVRIGSVTAVPAIFLPLVLAISGSGVGAGLPYDRVSDFLKVCSQGRSQSFCKCSADAFDQQIDLAEFLRKDVRYLADESSSLADLAAQCPKAKGQRARSEADEHLAPGHNPDSMRVERGRGADGRRRAKS